jgi:hypothetical protein
LEEEEFMEKMEGEGVVELMLIWARKVTRDNYVG